MRQLKNFMKAKKPMWNCGECKCITLQCWRENDEYCDCGDYSAEENVTPVEPVEPVEPVNPDIPDEPINNDDNNNNENNEEDNNEEPDILDLNELNS